MQVQQVWHTNGRWKGENKKVDFKRTTVFIALSQLNEGTTNLISGGNNFIIVLLFLLNSV